jgi:hypothetical protein
MLPSISDLTTRFTSKLGTCSRCTRTAFVFAVIGVVAASIATMILPPWIAAALFFVAVALIALWVGHVWMFVMRAVRATAVRSAAVDALQRTVWSRRRVLGAFFRTLLFSAMASAIPRTVWAQECNCYSDNDCSCPPDFPNCVFNPITGEAICCGPDSHGCSSDKQTWCCPPRSDCDTDGMCRPWP